jgi:hypothetical protein
MQAFTVCVAAFVQIPLKIGITCPNDQAMRLRSIFSREYPAKERQAFASAEVQAQRQYCITNGFERIPADLYSQEQRP